MIMKFCPVCEAVMSKSTTPQGMIIFYCRCQLVIDGKPDDTLMAEEYLETAESNLKHEVFIENAPFDPAGNIVLKDCPKCNLNFLTMIRIGTNETTMYACSCGYSATHTEYMKDFNKGPARASDASASEKK